MYDRFERRINYLRISVTDRCNLRCTYCMPAEGVPLLDHDDVLSLEEIRDFTATAVAMGVDKVRLTGGEPLVRRGIVDLVAMIAAIPGIRDFGMTTNGALLPRHAEGLKKAGLHRLNISLDSLEPERFKAITRNGELAEVLAGIEAAREAGFERIKLNCVIDRSPDEPDARQVAEYADRNGLEARFIRRMDTEKGVFSRVIGGDGGHCAECNRLRLSCTGQVYPCLFSDRTYSVRELGAVGAIRAAVEGKPASGKVSRNLFCRLGG